MPKNDICVAVCTDSTCGASPALGYIGKRADGKYIAHLGKLFLSAALLRCGFEVVDCDPNEKFAHLNEVAHAANALSSDVCITVSCSSYGSRKSFNDERGVTAAYYLGRFAAQSKILSEDVSAKLSCRSIADGVFGASCMAIKLGLGYLTSFEDVKRMLDPDFLEHIAERTALGMCEHFDVPYCARNDVTCYPLLSFSRRGKKVKLFQCLASVAGANLKTDGVFGRATEEETVKLFGEKAVTADAWRRLLSRDVIGLGYGSNGCETLYLQRKLYCKMYDTPCDGIFDERTLAALNAFLCDNRHSPLSRDEKIDDGISKLIKNSENGRRRLI